MLSIIISSYQPQYYQELEKNIEKTCGLEYQIIKIDNPNKMGIAQAYNEGAVRAKYPYLLFIHEDIQFHTMDWGKKLINHLNQDHVGIIGVAGSSYIPNVPASWYLLDCDYVYMSFIQNSRLKDNPIKRNFNIKQNVTKVIKVDGMFLGITKETYNRYKFNENIMGFHGYDTDISLRVSNNYNNYVVDDIILEHFSSGALSKEWIDVHEYIRKYTYHPNNSIYDEKLEMKMFIFYSKNYLNKFGVSTSTIVKILKYWPPNLSLNSKTRIINFFVRTILKR